MKGIVSFLTSVGLKANGSESRSNSYLKEGLSFHIAQNLISHVEKAHVVLNLRRPTNDRDNQHILCMAQC